MRKIDIPIPIIICQDEFENKYINNIDNKKFYISILDPDHPKSLLENRNNYKTFWFYDLEYDVGTYKPMSYEQAEDIYSFIKLNLGKQLVVHCGAGISRSAAVGEFYFEMLGGSYKELIDTYKNIMPSGRVLQYLRIAEASEKRVKYIQF